jgi:flagellar hook-associated protein 3 FlgL
MTHNMLTSYLLKNRDELYSLQEKTSSGKKVGKASDDPGSYDLISSMYHDGAMIKQYDKNCSRLEGDLLALDSKLQHAHDQLARAAEIVVSGGDGTKNPEDLRALGEELDQMFEEIVAVANTAPSGSYAFAGLRQNVPAYEVQRDADGRITSVTYQGSEETRKIEIAANEYLPANFVGSDLNGENGVFQTSEVDIFADLMHARDRLLNGDNLAEPETFTADSATDSLAVGDLYSTGASVRISSSENLPAGLSQDTTYYVIRVSDSEIQLAASLADARAGIAVDFTDAGSGRLEIAQTHLEAIERGDEQMMEVLTRLGAYEERIALTQSMHQTHTVNMNDRLDDEESIDIAEAIMELNNKQTAYEASLKVTTSALQNTLLNYM